MARLPRNARSDLQAILQKVMDEEQRKLILAEAFGIDHPILSHIEFIGNNSEFAHRLLTRLEDYDEIEDLDTLWALLKLLFKRGFSCTLEKQLELGITVNCRHITGSVRPLPANYDIDRTLRLLRELETTAVLWKKRGSNKTDHILWSHEELERVKGLSPFVELSFDSFIEAFMRPETERLLEAFPTSYYTFNKLKLIQRWTEIEKVDSKLLLIAAQDKALEVRIAAAEAIAAKSILHTDETIILVQALIEDFPRLFNSGALKRAIQFGIRLIGGLGKTTDQDDKLKAVNTLSEFAKHPSAMIRFSAVQALGKIQAYEAFQALAEALHDTNARVRKGAALSLGEIKDARAIPSLAEKVTDKILEVRIAAVTALGNIGHPDTVPALIAAASDTAALVRANAATALARTGDITAIGALQALENDPEATVRESAADAIQILQDIKDPVVSKATEFTSENEVLKALSSSIPGVCRTALKESYKYPSSKVFNAVKSLINNPHTSLAAIRAIGKFDREEAITELADAAQNSLDGGIRLLAAETLGKLEKIEVLKSIKTQEAIDVLDDLGFTID